MPGTAVRRPLTVGEAVQALASDPGAELLAGGTDLVPALREGVRRPRVIVALRRVVELQARGTTGDALTVGAGVTYRDLAAWSAVAGLARTAQVVGSPQVRNVATVGGALGTASPNGDLVTFLVAAEADVLLAGVDGRRRTPIAGFLAEGAGPAELVTAVQVPRPAGPQAYLKVGGRQAAYAAIVSCALLVDRTRQRVSCAFGGLTAAPRRLTVVDEFARTEIDWSDPASTAGSPGTLGFSVEADGQHLARKFAAFVATATAAEPGLLPDGPRVPTAYRVHAAGVLAGRALVRCLAESNESNEAADAPGAST